MAIAVAVVVVPAFPHTNSFEVGRLRGRCMACPVPVSFGYGDSILDPLASDSWSASVRSVSISW